MFYSLDFVKIVTSKNPNERGCQLSLIFSKSVTAIDEYISKRGVMVTKYKYQTLGDGP